MFFNILKRDLKRKKTMNIVLLIFIIMASMFLASSVNNLITVSGAVDNFIEISKVPDIFFITVGNKGEDEIEGYLKESDYTDEYQVISMFNISNDDIEILECREKPDNNKYEKTNTLSIGRLSNNFMKVFDADGNLFELNSGEIALGNVEAEENSISIGDRLKIKVGDIEQSFTVKVIVKDAVFGSSMMSFKRFCISDEDFEKYEEQENIYYTNIYNINTHNLKEFKDELGEKDFQKMAAIEKDTVGMCYIFDMLISCILIVVSVCLILIAFLILRFTIVFTLQEDYKEIGIMKAIGVRDSGIKSVYLVKYLAISLVGAAVGFVLSIPFEKLLLEAVIVNIVAAQTRQNILINIASSLIVVAIVLLFCYFSTNKLKKFTVIEAIRNGSNGERYRQRNIFKLNKMKKLSPPFYLALNDIISSFKSFAVLIIVFSLGTLLILLPMSAIDTLNSDDIIKSFSMVKSSAYLDNGKTDKYMVQRDENMLLSDLEDIENTLKREGIDCRVRAELFYIIPCYSNDPKAVFNDLITTQSVRYEDNEYEVIKGRCPEFDNEVMLTDITAKDLEVSIGDSIYFKYPNGAKEYIITGLYQSMMNMGKGIRMNADENIDYQYISGLIGIQVDVFEEMTAAESIAAIEKILPDCKLKNTQQFISDLTGGVAKQIESIRVLILIVVLIINCLMTILMMKTFISKEHGEIAMLKSIGFKNGSIRKWQIYRILIVLLFSIAAGLIISRPLIKLFISPIFGMMGATSIQLVIKPFETYVIYPLILLTITGISAALCSNEVNKVDLKEINSLE